MNARLRADATGVHRRGMRTFSRTLGGTLATIIAWVVVVGTSWVTALGAWTAILRWRPNLSESPLAVGVGAPLLLVVVFIGSFIVWGRLGRYWPITGALWLRLRGTAAEVMFLGLHGLLLVTRRAKLIGPVLVLVGIPLLVLFYPAVMLERLAPLVEDDRVRLSRFVTEQPLEPRSHEAAMQAVVEEGHKRAVRQLAPALASTSRALETIFEASKDGKVAPPATDSSLETALAELQHFQSTDGGIDERIGFCLRVRILLQRSHQGTHPQLVCEALRLIGPGEDLVRVTPGIADPVALALAESLENSRAAAYKHAAMHHAALSDCAPCSDVLVGSDRLLGLSAEALLDRAEEIWRRQYESGATANTRVRALNNLADEQLSRALLSIGSTHGKGPTTTETALDVEESLRARRAELELVLRERPDAHYMLTLAQFSSRLAHAGCERCRHKGMRCTPDVAIADLASTSRFLEMSLTCGLPESALQGNVHGLGLCWLLTAETKRYPKVIAQGLTSCRASLRDTLQRHQATFRCDTCQASAGAQ